MSNRSHVGTVVYKKGNHAGRKVRGRYERAIARDLAKRDSIPQVSKSTVLIANG